MANETIDAISDARITNNLMRHRYRVLNDDEKKAMAAVKDAGFFFTRLLHEIGGTHVAFAAAGDAAHQASRELSLAQTKIEEAVMWAVKHVTR